MKRQQFRVTAGIDVHRDTVVVTVRSHRDGLEDQLETKTFETFRDSLVDMARWVEQRKAEVVGLESTGVYWIPVIRALQETAPALVVWLINPLHVKARAGRGRKTDRRDSILISDLVMYGQVSPSYLPSAEQSEIRKLTRHRGKLVADQSRYKNRIIRELECSGLKLSSVLSDCLGKSGRAMIDAVLAGGKTPEQIADLARGRLREKIPSIVRAVEGAFTPSTAVVMRQLLKSLDDVDAQIAQIEAQIEALMVPYEKDRALAKTIPGVDAIASAAAIAESGVDMSLFPSARHLSAWSGLSPGSEQSAGKAKKAPTRKGNKFIRTTFVQCAWSAVRTKTCIWKATFRKLRARLGPKKAIVAIARKMLTAYYYILRDQQPYRPPASVPLPELVRNRLIRSFTAKLKALGVTIPLTSTEAVS